MIDLADAEGRLVSRVFSDASYQESFLMFEFLKKFAPAARKRQVDAQTDAQRDLVFWVDMPKIPKPVLRQKPTNQPAISRSLSQAASASNSPTTANLPTTAVAKAAETAMQRLGSHRERLLAMRLEHLKLCPPQRCQQLADVGVVTAGDLVFGDPKRIASAFQSQARAERAIRRYRAAIRLAASVDSMMPRDALLLVSVHRRSVASLSRESAAQLHRDLERFSLSTRGSKIIGRRGVPSLRRVKSWVATCRQLAESASTPKACQPAMS
ncbi:DUF4332 domain-containing protein [Neorhodopirellula lusitana]|nr:DUF4332 domain-containing protein [Neorhodopirellula lusitana]